MALTRYKTIVKVACSECNTAIAMGKPINTQCVNCTFLKYNNVTRLKKFTDFLHAKFPYWTYFNVFEYKKGEQGKRLASFQKRKNEPLTDSL